MSHLLLLPLLLFMDFGGNQLYSFKTENCFACKSPSSIVRFNRAYHHNEFCDAEVKAIKNHFNTNSFSWWVDIHDQKAAHILHEHGFIQYPHTFVGMRADITNLAHNTYEPPITVKEITQKEDIEIWIDIVFRNNPGYEKHEWEKSRYDLLEKGTSSIKLYVGFYAGEPCATSMIIYHKDMVTLHSINTLPEYRCKGLGYAVTHKALFDAACNGITQAILTASSLGQSLYQKMGFKEYAQYHIYLYTLAP